MPRRRARSGIERRLEGLARRSGLLRALPWLDGVRLLRIGLAGSAAAGVAALRLGAGAFEVVLASFAAPFAGYLALDSAAAIQGERTRRRLLELVGLLNRWCSVREDLLFAFEKSLSTGLGEPMRGHVRDLVTRIHGGMGVERALELFGEVSDHPQFRDFVVSVRFNLRCRGDLAKFLEGTETQLGRIEEEYNRRRISTARDRSVVLAVVAAVPPVAFWMLSGGGSARELFLGTAIGGYALEACALLYLAGAYLLLTVSGVRG